MAVLEIAEPGIAEAVGGAGAVFLPQLPWSPRRGPTRDAECLTSDEATRVGKRCGPPWGSGRGRSMRGALGGDKLSAQGRVSQFDPMGAMNDAVEDRVTERGVGHHLVPFTDRDLADDQQRPAVVAVVNDLEQIAACSALSGSGRQSSMIKSRTRSSVASSRGRRPSPRAWADHRTGGWRSTPPRRRLEAPSTATKICTGMISPRLASTTSPVRPAKSYRAWTGRLKPTMRQVHVAGERMFVAAPASHREAQLAVHPAPIGHRPLIPMFRIAAEIAAL